MCHITFLLHTASYMRTIASEQHNIPRPDRRRCSCAGVRHQPSWFLGIHAHFFSFLLVQIFYVKCLSTPLCRVGAPMAHNFPSWRYDALILLLLLVDVVVRETEFLHSTFFSVFIYRTEEMDPFVS